jgi:hypothetical protein
LSNVLTDISSSRIGKESVPIDGVEEGVPDDEPEFIVAVKAAKPKITTSELKDVITQFRAVVSERQQRGPGRR